MGIGMVLFKTFGVLSRKGCQRQALNLGKTLVEKTTAKGSALTNEEIGSVMQNLLGKRAGKFEYLYGAENIADGVQRNLRYDRQSATLFSQRVAGVHIPIGQGKKNLIVLNREIADRNNIDMCSLAAHEFEHALYNKFSFQGKFANWFITTPVGKRIIAKQLPKAKNLNINIECIQGKLMGMHGGNKGFTQNPLNMEGLLRESGMATPENLHNEIRRYLKDKDFDITTLRGAKKMLKDEARAYNVGGKIETLSAKANGTLPDTAVTTNSEMNALMYKEALKDIDKVIRNKRANKVRNFFGLKSKPLKVENDDLSEMIIGTKLSKEDAMGLDWFKPEKVNHASTVRSNEDDYIKYIMSSLPM